MHILSPETDNCPSWISGRKRMTVENISWSISTKEYCRPRRGLNPRPPGLQLDGASNWATKAGWNIGSLWHHDRQHNKYRSPWPIFHGPVILPRILSVNWCMNIIIWDYELVWSNSWPKSKCRSMWPTFLGPVILCYILKIIWCIIIIFWDYLTCIS